MNMQHEAATKSIWWSKKYYEENLLSEN